MTKLKDGSINDSGSKNPLGLATEEGTKEKKKGPFSFLSGALTSGFFAWLSFGLSQKIVGYFMSHPPNYNSAIAQSIAKGLKTLVVGMSFLATFTFSFIAFGLTIVFVRSLFDGKLDEDA